MAVMESHVSLWLNDDFGNILACFIHSRKLHVSGVPGTLLDARLTKMPAALFRSINSKQTNKVTYTNTQNR